MLMDTVFFVIVPNNYKDRTSMKHTPVGLQSHSMTLPNLGLLCKLFYNGSSGKIHGGVTGATDLPRVLGDEPGATGCHLAPDLLSGQIHGGVTGATDLPQVLGDEPGATGCHFRLALSGHSGIGSLEQSKVPFRQYQSNRESANPICKENGEYKFLAADYQVVIDCLR